MVNTLTYECIVPRDFANVPEQELETEISAQLRLVILSGQKFDGNDSIIRGLAITRTIIHDKFSWWLKVPRDVEHISSKYEFTGNLLLEQRPEMIPAENNIQSNYYYKIYAYSPYYHYHCK